MNEIIEKQKYLRTQIDNFKFIGRGTGDSVNVDIAYIGDQNVYDIVDTIPAGGVLRGNVILTTNYPQSLNEMFMRVQVNGSDWDLRNGGKYVPNRYFDPNDPYTTEYAFFWANYSSSSINIKMKPFLVLPRNYGSLNISWYVE